VVGSQKRVVQVAEDAIVLVLGEQYGAFAHAFFQLVRFGRLPVHVAGGKADGI
jgi:hypothetical protein